MQHNSTANTKSIFQSSEKMIQPKTKRVKRNWPWNELNCGESFSVELHEIKAETLRPLCSLKGRELGKKFRMIVHETCYEIGRIK